MFDAIHPKLPMRDKMITKAYYINKLDFKTVSDTDYDGYLMIEKDAIQIHFFEYEDLIPKENYGQVYIRTNTIDDLYRTMLDNSVDIHPNGSLSMKPWGTKEFSLLDPDHNLLTFGQTI